MSGARIISDSGLTSVYENAFVLALVVGGTLRALGLARFVQKQMGKSRGAAGAGVSMLYGLFVVAGLLLLTAGLALRPLRERAQHETLPAAQPAAAHFTSDKIQVTGLESTK